MDKKNTLLKLKARERKLRQQIIIDAAREVFGKKTYDKVSMAEIARAAGIAKSSIYTYFSSQEELYAGIVAQDSGAFIDDLREKIRDKGKDSLHIAVTQFLDYYIAHKAQWRMITHFALHGNRETNTIDRLNQTGRSLMDLFESVFIQMGCGTGSRLMAHTLFSCLSGILIAFRNYPGRTEEERIAHMQRIGEQVEAMVLALVEKQAGQSA